METADLSHHISRRFNEDLEKVRNQVLQMGGFVEQQLHKAITALVDWLPTSSPARQPAEPWNRYTEGGLPSRLSSSAGSSSSTRPASVRSETRRWTVGTASPVSLARSDLESGPWLRRSARMRSMFVRRTSTVRVALTWR